MFIHLAVHIPFADVRRVTTGVLASAVTKRPQLLNAVLRDALSASLTHTKSVALPSKLAVAAAIGTSLPAATSPSGEEQERPAVDRRGRYAAVLLACAGFGSELDKSARETLIVDWVVLAHHPAICTSPFLLERELN